MFACCAFAVFLLQQLLLPLTRLGELLSGKPKAFQNDTVTWSPGMAAMPPARRRVMRPVMALFLLFEVVAVGGSVAAATIAAHGVLGSREQQFLTAMHATICRAVGSPLS